MAQAYYSFLDVAALDGVRQRFAAGDALAILSADLGEVIWANGPGAALFGHAEVETILGVEAPLGAAAKRQIGALGGFPAIGRDRPLLVRVTLGVSSAALRFLASAVTLPDGEAAILLAQPANEGREGEAAALAVGGFAHAGHFLAFVDRAGVVEAASAGFGRLGLAQPALAEMAGEANEERRIVKRLLAGRRGPLPAGLARLTADRNLLVVIDENWEAAEAAEAGAQAPEPAEPAREFWYLGSEHVATETQTPGASETEAASEAAQATAAEDRQEPSAGTPGEAPASKEPTGEAEPAVVEQASPPAPSQDHPAGKDAQALHEAKPVRFVWRTDRDGKFSQLSPEFVAAVGEKAADVLGRRFQDVADVFALDSDGEIAGLLARRDTWSGRTVFWPVAGTDRKIPVDLAALPVYDRNRAFEGFRGFGVARPADAAVDPEGLGLVLTPIPVAAPEEPRGAGSPGADAAGQPAAAGDTEAATAAAPEDRQADPFKGETPALSVAAAHDRRYSDKVIRLAEHRPPAPERTPAAGNQKALSTGERIAFQQIGERLKQDSGKARRDAETAAAPAAERTRADAGVQHEAEASGQDREDSAAQAPVAEGKPAEPGQAASLAGAAAELRPRDAADEGKPAQPAAETGGGEAPATPAAKKPRPGMSLLDLAEWGREETQAEAPAAQVETEEAAAAEARVGARAGDEIVAASDDDADAGGQPAMVDGGVRDAAAEAAGAGPTADGQHEGPASPVGTPEAHAATDETFGLSILEKLPVPVLVHSGDTLHYANDQFFALTGYASVDELAEAGGIGALFADRYEDEAAQPADRHMRLKTKDGDEFPVEAFLQSVPWGEGKALILVLSRIRDGFGGQSPLIAELEARVAEMRTIIDTATDGVVLIARDGNIRSISRPAEALFGIDSDEVAGQPFASLFAIESQKAARDYLAGLSEHGVASVLNDGREVIGREAEGRFIPLFMTIGRLPGDSGFCAVVRDITQWKRAEEELTQARATAERSSSHKTEFLARVSHEIRTPLNAIIGFSELMLDEKFGPVANDRYRDYLRDINRSGNHVLDLVNDLLDISKIEAGQQEMAYEAVSLNETLAETVALMQPQANRERVIIRSSFASKLPDVVADLRSVRQIALNVLSNAVRYTQAGGQVIVSTAYENSGEVVMRVRDTGIGMTPAEIEQALKPFKQINSLKRTRGDGTGLGLPLTKAMVEANRAKFSIHSTPGEGTLVEVAFPSTRVLAD